MTTELNRTMLLYDFSWGHIVRDSADTPVGWNLLLSPERLKDAHAVIFHIPTAPDLSAIPKLPGQKWIAWSMENCVNYPQMKDAGYRKHFDLTMTYRWDSDVPAPYFGPHLCDAFRAAPSPKTAAAPAVYFASFEGDKAGRVAYVLELMHALPIHSYGKSLNNRALTGDNGAETKLATIGGYKFTLALENSFAPDYVTEKFFQPLMAGSVPVYRGAPNIDEFAPGDRCYIDAGEFGSPRELADYLLYLDRHPAEYEAYFAWKRQPFREAFERKLEQLSPTPFARLARKLEETRDVPATPHPGLNPRGKALRWMLQSRSSGSHGSHML